MTYPNGICYLLVKRHNMAQFIGFGDQRDGSISSATGTINSYASMTANSGSYTVTTALSVSVGDMVFLHQSRGANAGNCEMVRVASTGAGSFTTDRTLINTYAAVSQAVKVPQYSSGTCSNTISGTDWDGSKGGIIIAVGQSGTFTGTIAVPKGFRGSNVNQADEYGGADGQGEGTSGDRNAASNNANGNGGGGGKCERNGDSARSGGGGGGNGTAGSNGTSFNGGTVGSGGGTAGAVDLSTIVFGGGGGGTEKTFTGAHVYSDGGYGGGIVILIFKQIDTSSATITASGGAGGGDVFSMAGGSGAGGSVLILTQTGTLGTNKITAPAGSVTAGGGLGGVGRIAIKYLTSYTGTTTPSINATQDSSLSDSNSFFAFF